MLDAISLIVSARALQGEHMLTDVLDAKATKIPIVCGTHLFVETRRAVQSSNRSQWQCNFS